MLSRYELEMRRDMPHYFARAASVVVGPFDSCDFSTTLTHADIVLAIEAAWTYVAALGGGEVVVLESDYGDSGNQIDSQGDNVVLRGMGYGSFLRTSGAFHVISISGHNFITVRGFRIAQESAANNNDGIFIEDGANYFRIERIWITDSDRAGIRLMAENTAISYGWILNCYITGTDNSGINSETAGGVNQVNYVVIMGNILAPGTYGVRYDTSQNWIIAGNIILSGSRSIANFGWSADYSVITNNTIYDPSGDGFFTFYSSRGVFSENVIYSPGTDGIIVMESDYWIISNNIIYEPTGGGIEFDDSDFCSCLGNTIYSAGDVGILFGAGIIQEHCTINFNTIIAPADNCIELASCNRSTIMGNFCYDSVGGAGISHGGASLVAYNYVYSCAGYGIRTWTVSLVIGNLVESNGSQGIALSGGTHHLVISNYCISNGAYGIIVEATVDSAIITGNFTRANTTACCRVDNANCDETRIWLNNFDEGAISDIGTNTTAFDNFDPSAKGWIAMINAPAGGR